MVVLPEDDEATADAMNLARELGLTVHVRGTDGSPVVELRDRLTRRVVGGTELRRRMADDVTREWRRKRLSLPESSR